MSSYSVSLRIMGVEADENMDDVLHLLEGTSYRFLKKGMRYQGKRIQPLNVVSLDLVPWETDDFDASTASPNHWQQVVTILAPLATGLSQLDRAHYQPSLYISTIRDHYMGGFGLSAEIVSTACKANLPIDISILVAGVDAAPQAAEDNEEK